MESVVTVGWGVGSTVTVTVDVPVQPAALYSTVYVVVVLGATVSDGPVPTGAPLRNQLKTPPAVGELEVSVPVAPSQMVIGFTVMDGPGLTVTVVVAFTVPQLGTVNVTV
jgi:hypothetical protein